MNDHPVRLVVTDADLRRARLVVFFRYLLGFPHAIWLWGWGLLTALALIVNWLALLITGRPIVAVHRFVSAYLRYQTHVAAFMNLVANPFPGFTGTPGSYPVDLVLPGPERQHRLKTLFRIILAWPALLVAWPLAFGLGVVAFLSWFVALVRGRVSANHRDLGAYALRYNAQVSAYLLLLTDRYPVASPLFDALPVGAALTAPVVPAVE
jgi:hypothetical protein